MNSANYTDFSSYRFSTNRQGKYPNQYDDSQENNYNTIGSKDIEVNHGSPICIYQKESPLKNYYNTLKKAQINEEFSNESENNTILKEELSNEINIPKFPDLSNTKCEEENFELNSKDFLDQNRILRNEAIRNHSFLKKNNKDLIKEIYNSFDQENVELENECLYENPKHLHPKFQPDFKNLPLFESFNHNVPKLPAPIIINKPIDDNLTENNLTFKEETFQTNLKEIQLSDGNRKDTPEFQKFKTILSNSKNGENFIKPFPKKFSIDSSGLPIDNHHKENSASSNDKLKNLLLKNGYERFDLPLKYANNNNEVFNYFPPSPLKENNRNILNQSKKSTEYFDENIDENLSRDLQTKINDHLSFKKENIKVSRVPKRDILFDNEETATTFKNTNSSMMNPNSDRNKASPIISIQIHESIKKNEKNSINNPYKFLEDYRYECAKNKQSNLYSHENANKISTGLGLSSIECTDNNSDKPLYVLNMEIISSNCLSPKIKENIINLLKSNTNYILGSNDSSQSQEKGGLKQKMNQEKNDNNPAPSSNTQFLKVKNNNEMQETRKNSVNPHHISLDENLSPYPQKILEKISSNDKKLQTRNEYINLEQKKTNQKTLSNATNGRKFSLSNIKNIKVDELFSNIKKKENFFMESNFNKNSVKKEYNFKPIENHNRSHSWTKILNKSDNLLKSTSKNKKNIDCTPIYNFQIKDINNNHIITKDARQTKNSSSPLILAKKYVPNFNKKERNVSFHSKNEEVFIPKHERSTTIIGNYLPHVKTKQTILEYELFKKQKQRENQKFYLNNKMFDQKIQDKSSIMETTSKIQNYDKQFLKNPFSKNYKYKF